MVWFLGLLLIFILFLCWLLLSPFYLELDTRVPMAGIKWKTIAHAMVWYDKKWLLQIRAPFFSRTFNLDKLKKKPGRIKKVNTGDKEKKRRKLNRMLKMIIPITKTFRVTEWKLALDTCDYTLNAPLYPVNFLPYTYTHIFFNFQNENYLVLKVRNRPLKILYVFLKSFFYNNKNQMLWQSNLKKR